jgi:hypothetical protein
VFLMPNSTDSLRFVTALAIFSLAACTTSGLAQSRRAPPAPELPAAQAPTYADLADLALAGRLVAVVEVDDQRTVPLERAPGLIPGHTRLYLETITQRLLAGPSGVGATLTFLVDQPLAADGDAPELEKRSFIIFGEASEGRPGEVQLVTSKAMLPAGPIIEARVREVLTQIAARDALPAITGVRDVISVPGNLAGESETQLFVATAGGAPVSLSVIRRPQMAPAWGVSLGEIVNQDAAPPAPDTIAWYRFACFLPRELPQSAFLQSDRESQARARADYAFVLRELGPCERRL